MKINILTTCMYIIKVSINLLSITGFFYKLAFKLIDHETMCCLAYCFIKSTYLSLNYTNTKVEYFLNIGEFSEGIIKEVEEYEHAN